MKKKTWTTVAIVAGVILSGAFLILGYLVVVKPQVTSDAGEAGEAAGEGAAKGFFGAIWEGIVKGDDDSGLYANTLGRLFGGGDDEQED